MIEEGLAMVAASAATAIAEAAGTGSWEALRAGVARWFSRGDGDVEHTELERLDDTASALALAGPAAVERERGRQEAAWQSLIEGHLRALAPDEQHTAAASLAELLHRHSASGPVSAAGGGLAAGGDVGVRAEGGSFAAGVNHGQVTIGPPHPPGPARG